MARSSFPYSTDTTFELKLKLLRVRKSYASDISLSLHKLTSECYSKVSKHKGPTALHDLVCAQSQQLEIECKPDHSISCDLRLADVSSDGSNLTTVCTAPLKSALPAPLFSLFVLRFAKQRFKQTSRFRVRTHPSPRRCLLAGQEVQKGHCAERIIQITAAHPLLPLAAK